jgi:peptidoglycan/LPS O-acetylase OafA/YrhL
MSGVVGRVPAARAEGGKVECFESVRGLASFAVLVAHTCLAFWPAFYTKSGPLWDGYPGPVRWLAASPARALWDGHFAVSIFFVLSGFVLSLSFFRTGSADALTSAAARRYVRLMLPALASVLLGYGLVAAGAMHNQAAVRLMDATLGAPHGWLGQYFDFPPRLLTALRDGACDAFLTGASQYNPFLWTMPVELTGSFLVFAFLALYGRARGAGRAVFYAAFALLFVYVRRFFLVDFLLGVAMCDLYVRNEAAWRRHLPAWAAVPVVLLGLWVVAAKPGDTTNPHDHAINHDYAHETVGAVLILAAVGLTPRLRRALEAGWLRFLGRVSFGLYLVHLAVICSAGSLAYLWLRQRLGLSHHAGAGLAALVCVVVSLLGAWAVYAVVDRSAITLSKWLYARLVAPRRYDQPPAESRAARAA